MRSGQIFKFERSISTKNGIKLGQNSKGENIKSKTNIDFLPVKIPVIGLNYRLQQK